MENRELETAVKFMEHTDRINKRLANTIMCGFIVFGITIMSMCAFYFFADYQYPTTEQSATPSELSQSIK